MNPHSTAVRGHLERVKELFGNIFVLLEQSLALRPETELEQRIELNSNVQNLMIAAGREFNLFQSAWQRAQAEHAPLDADLNREVERFCEFVPQALRALKQRIDDSCDALLSDHDELKQQLLKLQISQKGFQGYKSPTAKNPRMLDSTI